jgi:hypothetical protein
VKAATRRLLFAALLAAACVASRGEGDECLFNGDCKDPLVCAGHRCRAQCRDDRDCNNGWKCRPSGQRSMRVCLPPGDYGYCAYSAECDRPSVCQRNGACGAQCRTSYDCAVYGTRAVCAPTAQDPTLRLCSDHPDYQRYDGPALDASTPIDVADAALDADVARADVVVDAPSGDARDAADAPVDGGPSFPCAVRVRAGACTPGPGCGVVAVGIGVGARCALLSDGSVRCWGAGASGTLGNGTTANCPVPGLVRDLVDAAEIGVGNGFACARRRGAMGVQCWGQSFVGEVGNGTAMGAITLVPTTISAADNALFVGNSHSCTLGAGGAASCWGTNADGQFGNGTLGGAGIFNYFATPRSFSLPVGTLALGVSHACGVGLDGAARCWGSNGDGALGDGTMTASPSPVLVSGLAAVAQVVVGQGSGCARLADGTARCWGLNNAGQLGDGTMTSRGTPVTPAVTDVAELAMAGFTSCARRGDGSVWCWGARESAGMGAGAAAVLTPAAVPGLTGVTRLYGGRGGFCALRGSDADLVCWGVAAGNGSLGVSPTPEPARW